MGFWRQIFSSSVGRKAVAASTGLVLLGFVIGHLAGNLQIFMGPNQINAYAAKLRDLGLCLWGIRLFLLAAVILHIGVTIELARENRAARPAGYVYEGTVQATTASRTMVISGIVLSAFILYHLAHFTFHWTNPAFAYLKDPLGRHDVYAMMVLAFQNYYVTAAYIVAMAALTFHIAHGASSWAQSFGLNDDRWMPLVRNAGNALAVLIFLGYVSIPVAVFLNWIELW